MSNQKPDDGSTAWVMDYLHAQNGAAECQMSRPELATSFLCRVAAVAFEEVPNHFSGEVTLMGQNFEFYLCRRNGVSRGKALVEKNKTIASLSAALAAEKAISAELAKAVEAACDQAHMVLMDVTPSRDTFRILYSASVRTLEKYEQLCESSVDINNGAPKNSFPLPTPQGGSPS